MPTWKSIDAFQRDVATLTRSMDRELGQATRRMAERAERIAVQEARRDLGGDSKFSGWPGVDLSHLRIRAVRPNAHIIYPARDAAGGWTTATVGRNRGESGSFLGPGVNRRTGLTSRTKSGNIRKVRSFRERQWNGYSPAFGTADRAVRAAEADAAAVGEKAFRAVLSKRFDVT